MKAHFNQLLENQKLKVQNLESQVVNAKLTYADALRNLEKISDEIHQTRSRTSQLASTLKQASVESNESFADGDLDVESDYKSLPQKLGSLASPIISKQEDVDGYKSLATITPQFEDRIVQSHSSEWTDINLDVSSPEEEAKKSDTKPKLLKQKTLPNPLIENEYSSIKGKAKLESTISNWISRSSAKSDTNCLNSGKFKYLDVAKPNKNTLN